MAVSCEMHNKCWAKNVETAWQKGCKWVGAAAERPAVLVSFPFGPYDSSGIFTYQAWDVQFAMTLHRPH